MKPPSLLPGGTSLQDSSLAELKLKPWRQLQWQTNHPIHTEKASLNLQAGRLIAITGPSGSGKTTLLDRVCGLLAEEHSQWVVESDNESWHLSGSAGARQLHQLIAYAPQDAVLFEASLRDNLLMGHKKSKDRVESWLHRLRAEPSAAAKRRSDTQCN